MTESHRSVLMIPPKFVKFFEYLSTRYNMEVHLSDVECDKEYLHNKRNFCNRLTIIGNEKIEEVAREIHSEIYKYFSLIKREIQFTLLYYDTTLKLCLPKWTQKDFEDLYFVLYGQEEK